MIVIFLKINQIFLNYQKYFPTQKKEPHTRYGSLCLSFLFTTFTATSQNLLQLAYGNEILACMSQDFVTFAPKHLGGLRAQGGGEGGSCGLRNSELLPPISCSPPLIFLTLSPKTLLPSVLPHLPGRFSDTPSPFPKQFQNPVFSHKPQSR